jgi:hypothetical protein
MGRMVANSNRLVKAQTRHEHESEDGYPVTEGTRDDERLGVWMWARRREIRPSNLQKESMIFDTPEDLATGRGPELGI